MNTDPHIGLTSQQVAESRKKHGSNQLTPPERDPWWKELLEKFTDPLIVILMVAAFISLIPAIFVPGHSWIESVGIVCAVLIAVIVGFINEYKANREFDILNQVNDVTPVRVVRDGKHAQVPKTELVVGDIVLLEAGEEIPADGQLCEAVSFLVNQSSLTGESEPVQKSAEGTESGEQGAYATNLVLRSTMVTEGHAIMQVTQVGDNTEIGKVARAAAEDDDTQSPLNQQLGELSKGINVAGFSIAFILLVSLIARDVLLGNFVLTASQWYFFVGVIISIALALPKVWYPVLQDLLGYCKIDLPAPKWVEAEGLFSWIKCLILGSLVFGVILVIMASVGMITYDPVTWMPAVAAEHILLYFMIAITLIVVAVPEGLPMSITLSLAYSMRKMAKQNNLVRQMDACETIGAATVICSDKTGTLTLNEMTVKEACFAGLADAPQKAPIYSLLSESIAVNSTANLTETGEHLGNVTEGAMLKWICSHGSAYIALRGAFKLISQLPFSTMNKFMATFGTSAVLGKNVIFVKGAPEIVLARCTSSYDQSLTDEVRNAISASIKAEQCKAMRVLGIAYKVETGSPDHDTLAGAAQGLVWLGYFAIQDPVRADVPAAVESCRHAGIDVKIVTGDNRETACQIGREIGLLPSDGIIPDGAVMTGDEFDALSDDELNQRVAALCVLSRARPLDKLRLVNALQANHHVVAVTGDGTNDAPALSHADVGLSMGITGTSVAKEASDIILLDDSFSSITKAVMWGRSLYRNIQKFIVFQLTVNVAACGIAALGPFTGVELPLTVTQMLWVNLIMDTFAAIALATEPPSDDVMEQRPRNKLAFIITPAMWQWILWFGVTFVIAAVVFIKQIPAKGAEGYEHGVTILFTSFVLLQFWNLFNARVFGTANSFLKGLFKNPSFLFIAIVILIGQYVAVQFGGSIFRTVPLSLSEWGLILLCTSPVLIIGEIVRATMRARS